MYPKQFWNEFRLVDYPDKIFVGMWFDDGNVEKRYNKIIRKAIEQTELKPLFLKEVLTGDTIPIDIMRGIIECKLVLFDISPMDNKNKTRNSNVMYEIGLAHTWRNKEEVILIGEDISDLPFDIQSFGVMRYYINNEKETIETIKNTINFRLQEIEKIRKSRVIKAATSLTIDAFQALMGSRGQVFVITSASPTFYIASLPLLLNLGLIEFLTDIKGTGGGFGYHPTQLGREVIRFYGGELLEDNLQDKYPTLYKIKYES